MSKIRDEVKADLRQGEEPSLAAMLDEAPLSEQQKAWRALAKEGARQASRRGG